MKRLSYIITVATVLLTVAISVHADEAPVSKNQQTIQDLQAKINQLKKDSASYMACTEYKKWKILTDSIALLEGQVKNIGQMMEETIQKAKTTCEDRQRLSKQQQAGDAALIAKKEGELTSLIKARQNYIASLIADVDNIWTKKNYSQMTLEELESALKPYAKFEQEVGVAEAHEKMKALHEDFKVYNKGKVALTRKYDAEKVGQYINDLQSLIDRTTDETKKQELANVHQQLVNYGEAVGSFKKLIKDIDGITSEDLPHKALLPMVKATVTKHAPDIAAIKAIPWLSDQYEEYYEALKEDCKAPNQARNTIVNL